LTEADAYRAITGQEKEKIDGCTTWLELYPMRTVTTFHCLSDIDLLHHGKNFKIRSRI
jgi:hypothetical protein